jgi:hypothetical protein
VTEETVLNPDSEGGKQLAIVEGLQGNKTTILRFGGIGEDRNPFGFSRSRKSRKPWCAN